jgi:hypothetical protein
METETPSARRPASWLLIVLGLVLVAFVGYRMWPDESAAMPPPAQTPARTPQGGKASVAREDLKVRLEALTAKRADPGDVERNPFRFRPPPAPPAPKYVPPPKPVNVPPPLPPAPVIPPIPLKFMGTVEGPGIKLAALTDCKGFTYSGREGETIDGQYKLVRIQVESIVIEYVNGTGRTTITKSGECPRR